MNGPPKRKRGLPTALETAKLTAQYHAARLLAKLFERPFWFFEQRLARLMDRIENERSGT